jgi:MICOS complex subunit MIC60
MDPADASSSSQKQEQLENNVEASKLDRALDELALKQANVQALETKMREMEKQHEEDLEKNEREHALKAEETVLAERAKRVKQLDEERVRFGALKTVLSSRRKALEEAKIAHEIVAGVSKLSEKIEKGESFAREMRVLKKVAENDDVLRALLSVTEKTLDRLASKDVPTVAQLRDALEKQVKRDARRVYLIPKEGGGMLAHAVASLASLIKVEEVVGKDNNTSLEAAISKVEMLLRDDRDSVGDAARILLKASEHSKAKDVVQSWATSAMEREEIDFILRSLIAHANAKSSGV